MCFDTLQTNKTIWKSSKICFCFCLSVEKEWTMKVKVETVGKSFINDGKGPSNCMWHHIVWHSFLITVFILIIRNEQELKNDHVTLCWTPLECQKLFDWPQSCLSCRRRRRVVLCRVGQIQLILFTKLFF